MRNNKLIGVFKKKIRNDEFKRYCDFYKFDADQAKKDLISRGYVVLSI